MLKRLSAVFLCVCLAASMLVGCAGGATSSPAGSNGAGGDITLRFSWWGGDERHTATIEVIKLYEERNPGVHIEAEYSGFDGYREKLTTQISGGQAPDIIQVDQPWMETFLSAGEDTFIDLSTYSEAIDLSQFEESLLDQFCYYDGRLLGLPTGVNASGFVLNGDIAEQYGLDVEQPITWDWIIEQGKKLHEQDEDKYLLLSSSYELSVSFLRTYLMQKTGNNLLQDDYILGFTEEDLKSAIELLKEMYDNNVFEPVELADVFYSQVEQNPEWLNGNLCGYLGWVSTVTGRSIYFDNTLVLDSPQLEGGKDTGVIVRPAQLIAVPSTSKYPEEAAKFINFMMNDPDAVSILKDVRSIPASQSARALCMEKGYLSNIAIEMTDLAMEDMGIALNTNTNSDAFDQIVTDVCERICYFGSSAEQLASENYALFLQTAEDMKTDAGL